MAQRSKPDGAKQDRARPAPAWLTSFGALRPDLSRRGLARLGIRVVLACGCVGALAMLAGWSVRGVLDRGGLERLISMKNTLGTETPRRGALDRGRLKALVQADGKGRQP